MEKRRFIAAQRPFYYRGKKVIGAWSPTKKQFIKTYALIWSYMLIFFYVIFRAMICQCAWVTVPQAVLVGVVTLFTFLITAALKRKFERQNFVYEGEDITKIPE